MLKINPALRSKSDVWIVDNRVLNRELARAALKGRRHLLESNARSVDRGGSPFRRTLRRSVYQLAKRRFVAQDKVGEGGLAGADFATRAEKQIEVSPLEMRIEMGETDKGAGVGCLDPRSPAVSGRRHRARANSSAQGSQACLATAPCRG